MIAEFHSAPDIIYEIKRKYDIELSIGTITHYKKAEKWQSILKKFRKEYTDAVDSVPGAHKRVRMERMEKIWEKAEEKEDIKSAITVTEHQRKEIEGDGNKHNGDNILVQFNSMSDEELQKELRNTIEYIKKIEKKQIINAEVVNGNG